MGGLDTLTAGRVQISGVDITNMNENRLAQIRNRRIGFVFQLFNLIVGLRYGQSRSVRSGNRTGASLSSLLESTHPEAGQIHPP